MMTIGQTRDLSEAWRTERGIWWDVMSNENVHSILISTSQGSGGLSRLTSLPWNIGIAAKIIRQVIARSSTFNIGTQWEYQHLKRLIYEWLYLVHYLWRQNSSFWFKMRREKFIQIDTSKLSSFAQVLKGQFSIKGSAI